VSILLSLRRLHGIREAEEEQKKSALATAVQELHRLESAIKLAQARGTQGRILLNASADSGESTDRIAAKEEIAAARRLAKILGGRVRAVQENLEKIQKEFLATRVQRRQAGTLLEIAIAQNTADEKRKSQSALDDWHRSRRGADRCGHGDKVQKAIAPRASQHPETLDTDGTLVRPTDSDFQF